MQRDAIDLGSERIPRLFKIYFIPTLFGMLSLCGVTAVDGIFIGHGVGSDGLAAVNICIAPVMALTGVGLMLGMGCSVVSSIHLAKERVKAARLNITQALTAGTLVMVVFLLTTLTAPAKTAVLLGASPELVPMVIDYMSWAFPCVMFQIWCAIGLFVVRLDGSPTFAMWCNVIPGLLNIVLDYVFIFPLGMGLKGAAIATFISCGIGGIMVLTYLGLIAHTLRLIRIKLSKKSLMLSLRNIGYQCKIGISAFLGETTMGVLMITGNFVFMHYVGENGVGAFSIACYYMPFVFMIGNAIAQSAQPIISYNFALDAKERVGAALRIAVCVAALCGLVVTTLFTVAPEVLVSLFLGSDTETFAIAAEGLPLFALSFVFFIFNLTVIGYYQSVERVATSIVFALLRGVVFIVPAFISMPRVMGITGIWLALAVSELLTALAIIAHHFIRRKSA